MKKLKNNKTKFSSFIKSDEWLSIRYYALLFYGNDCHCCGNGVSNGVQVFVSHILDRKAYPTLSLDINNLQILCVDCFIGSRGIVQKNYRTKLT